MMQDRRRGFALVELLVVISLILLLLALLLPALASARAVAMQTTCAANLKQLHVASTIYTEEWKGWVIPAYDADATTPYVYGRLEETMHTSVSDVFTCPTSPNTHAPGVEMRFGHYGINAHIAGWPYSTVWMQRPYADIKTPSQNLHLFDAGCYAMRQTYVAAPSYAYWYIPGSNPAATAMADDNYTLDSIEGRHSGRTMNVVWSDGHADSRLATDLNDAKWWDP